MERQDEEEAYRWNLSQAARLEVCIPVRAAEILEVRVDGRPNPWKTIPGFGCSLLTLTLQETKSVCITLRKKPKRIGNAELSLAREQGSWFFLDGLPGEIVEVVDPQHLLTETSFEGCTLSGGTTPLPGHYLLLLTLAEGGSTWKTACRVEVTKRLEPRVSVEESEADAWRCVDLSGIFNATIPELYRQAYHVRRPPGCSTHLASDGFSPWTYTFWQLDAFCLPARMPETLQLGEACRAVVVRIPLKGNGLKRMRLTCLSADVVIGLVGVSVRVADIALTERKDDHWT